jgi:hypothetical protein
MISVLPSSFTEIRTQERQLIADLCGSPDPKYWYHKTVHVISVKDPRCLSQILYLSRVKKITDPISRVKKITDPGSGSALKTKYFNPKNCLKTPGNIIWDVHPGFGS